MILRLLIVGVAASALSGALQQQGQASLLGVVHPSILPTQAGQGESVQSFFGFGAAMVYNTVGSEGGMTLRQSVEFHCQNASVNQLSMLIAPPTEGGVVSNPADTDPWIPAKEPNVGMVQAAARFSRLARSTCPQATGVIIDDFLQQYIGRNDTGGCVNATCPASQPFRYGSSSAGVYCCPHKSHGGDCDRPACKEGPSHSDCACCLIPGSSKGCQGATRCAGHPKGDKPACPLKPQITLAHMKDIKAAVQGKTVRSDGTVDHDSSPLTPHLTLGVVWYDFELLGNYDWVKQDGLLDVIDVVTPWVWHQSPTATSNYSTLISTLRKYVGPHMPLYPGVYIKNSAIGWCPPESVKNLITQTAAMYDAGDNLPSTMIFAGVWLEADHMNQTIWNGFGLEELLRETIYDFVGTASILVQSSSGKAVVKAEVVVHLGETFVTRKLTDSTGSMEFAGWAGRKAPASHTVTVRTAQNQTASKQIQLLARDHKGITITVGQQHV